MWVQVDEALRDNPMCAACTSTVSACLRVVDQVNEALCDNPGDTLDFNMKQDMEKAVKAGSRISSCMSK